jgi:hypothetical protein
MSKQAAILVALGLLAAAASLVSLGTWILLRRGHRPAGGEASEDVDGNERTGE